MPVQKITIESFSPDGEEYYTDCVINFRGTQVTLEVVWAATRYVYVGQEAAKLRGKYELTCAASKGRVTLYRLPGNDKAICHWRDPGNLHGIWEIDLDDYDQFSI